MFNLFRVNDLKTIFQVYGPLSRTRLHHRRCKDQLKIVCTGKPKPLIDFECKVALITGGSEGIGLAIAHELLSEKVKNVALIGTNNCTGRGAVDLLNTTYGKSKAIFFNCDVQDGLQVADCYTKVKEEFGKVDIVINAAGAFDGCNWEREIMTNLCGTIHNMLEAYKVMSKEHSGHGGVILNFSGLHGIKPFYAAPTLSASFHGIVGLSRSFGHSYNFQSTGVRVVTISPGITNTGFVKGAEKRALTERMASQLRILLSKLKRQNASVCAQSALYVLKYGCSGSVWVVEGSNLYSLEIPSWKSYRNLESQLI